MRVTPAVRRAGLALLLGVAVTTCQDAPTGPGRGARASLALAPVLPVQAANLAAFGLAIDSLRVVVIRPATDTVVDTTVAFAADQDSLELAVSIPLDESPETFDVAMELRGGGFVLFSAATAAEISSGSNPPVEVTNFTYSGPGAGVTNLQVTPSDSAISFGDSLRFQVDAFAGEVPVTQFYVSWSTSAANTTVNAHGVMIAPAQRGKVFVTATTPNGVTSTVPVTFVPLPTSVAAVPPLPQNVPASSPIGPLRVRVLAADGLGVKGVGVTFAAVSGGGAVDNAVVATDSAGYAQTDATSGPTGTSVYSATVTGLTPVTFNVIVVGQVGTQLAFAFPPAGAIAGQPFAVGVEVRDALGNVVAGATDEITIALGANPGDATLGGTLTVNAVQGIAVFADLTINQPDTGYTLVATAPGLTSVTSASFPVIAGFSGRLWTNAAGGNWNNPANWSDSIVPAVGDTAYIALDGDYVVTLDVDVSVSMLFIGGASGTQTLTGTSRALGVDSLLTLSPTAVINLVGGTLGGSNASVFNQGSLRLQNAPLAAATVLNFAGGSLLARGTTGVTGTLVNAAGATVRIEGDPTCCSTAFSAGEISNAGHVELTSINGSSTNVSLTVLGEFANAPGATLAVLPGTGGSRAITAQINNVGVLQIDYDVVLASTGALHSNSGTVQLSGGNLTVNQAGPGSFYSDGFILIGAGRTLAINGGTVDYDSPAPGGIGGLGTLSLSNVTFGLDTDLGNDTLNLNLINTQVLGSGTLTSAAARTLTIQSTSIAVPFINNGTFVVYGNSALSNTITTVGGSTIRLLGDPGCCNTTLTVPTGWTNNGLLELTSANGSTTNVALVVSSGTFNNATGATLAVLPGTGGGRTIQAQLVNSGSMIVAHDVTLNAPDVDYLNTGQIHLTTGNLTLTQSGGTPTFAANGPIIVDAGRTFTVNGGYFQHSNPGNLGGLGTVAFNATSVSLVAGITHDTLSLAFVNSVVDGPGTLQTASGRSLTIRNSTINAGFLNFGQLVVQGASALNGTVTANTGSAITVQADPGIANGQLTVASGFTNNGLLELTQTGGPTASAALVVPSGFLVNAPGGTVASRAGTGGGRNLDLALNNQGVFLVETTTSLGGASADHVNSGTIHVSGATTFLLAQSGTTPTFSNTGSFVVDGGAGVNVSGGAFNYQNAAPGGLAGNGNIAFINTVLNLTPALSNDTLSLSFTGSTVLGSGTLSNALGRTLIVHQTALNAAFENQGVLIVRGTTSLGAGVTASAGGTFRLEGDPGIGNATLSVANPFTNDGLIELTSVNGSITNVSMDVAGGLTNGPDGTLAIRAGTGGGRALPTALINNGQLLVETTASIGTANASYVNSGTVTVTSGTLTLPLTGTTPVFTNQGVFTVAAGATVAVTGGPGGSFVNATSGTLAGAGTFDVGATTFTNSGTVSPGVSAGVLQFVGTYPMTTSSVLSIEIGGLAPGTQHDRLDVGGTATLSGTLNVSLINGFTPSIGQSFTIVSGPAVSGAFQSLNLPSVAGAVWLPNLGPGGFQLSLVSASALIPVLWTGSGGDNLWGNGANWSTGTPPGTGDSAVVNIGGPVTIVVNTNATAAFLDIGTVVGNGTKTLSLGAPTLTLTAGGIVGGDGVVNLAGGTLTGGGTLQIDGAFNWTSGSITGAGLVQVNTSGAMTLSGTGAKNLNSRKILTQGIVSWSDGTINSGGGAELRVDVGGSFTVQGNGTFVHSLGGGVPRIIVEPAGTLTRSTGTGIASFQVPLDNNGFTYVLTGTLDLRGGTSSGTFDIAGGTQLDFASGSFSLLDGSQFVGAGLARVAGATVDVGASTAVNRLHLVSGTVQGANALVVQDSLVWTGGTLAGTGSVQIVTGADLVINGNVSLNGRAITNGGTLTWLTGQISSGNGAVVTNQSIGLVDLRHDGVWLYNLGGTLPRLANQGGVVQRGTGMGVADIRAAVDNGGSVVMQSGTLALNGGGNSSGAFNVIPGTELVFGGAHTLTGSVTAAGVVSFSSGTTNVNGTYDVTGQTVINGGSALFNGTGADTARTNQLSVQSGTLGGTGIVEIRGAGTVSGGTLSGTGELRVPPGATLNLTNSFALNGRTLTNAGQVTWSAGQISSGNGAAFINQNGGIFDAPAGNTWLYNLGGAQPAVNNQPGGLIRRMVVTGTTTFAVPVNNAGTLNVQLGTLVLSVGGVASGSHTVATGATLQYGGTANSWTTGAGYSGAGRVLIPAGTTVNIDAASPDTVDARWIELAGGTIAGLGVLHVVDSLVWTGGSLTQAGVTRIPSGGLLAIRGAAKTFSARTIANAGVVLWTGTGTIGSGNGAALVNENGASFLLESDADWIYNQGGAIPHIDNLGGGLIKRTTATSAISVGAALNNDGIVDLQSGSVTFTNGGSSKGAFTLTSPGVLGFGGGTHTLDGGATLNGTGSVHVTGGALVAIGDYIVTGTTRISGGTAQFDGSKPAEITTLDLSGGTLSGIGQVFLHGSGNWSSGAMTGTGQFRVMPGASLILEGGDGKALVERTILNQGTIVWKDGRISSGRGAVLNIDAGASFNADAKNAWLYDQGGALTTIHIARDAFMNFTTDATNIAGGVVINNQGTLDIGPTATLKMGGELNLLNGSTLRGSGVLDVQGASKVVNQGTTRPGTSPGVLRIVGDWSPDAEATLVIEIFGPEVGTGHDQLVVSGRLTPRGLLQLVGNGTYQPPRDLSIPVVRYGSYDDKSSFSVSLTGGLTGLQGINYLLTELRMQF